MGMTTALLINLYNFYVFLFPSPYESETMHLAAQRPPVRRSVVVAQDPVLINFLLGVLERDERSTELLARLARNN